MPDITENNDKIDKTNRILLMIKRGVPETKIASMMHVSLDYVDSIMADYVSRL